MFSSLLGHFLVLVLWASKPQRVCNKGPVTVLQRKSNREPNTDLAWTLYITLFTCWAVSFILWRQATLLKPSPHSLPVFTEESSWTGCRIRRPTSQKPSAQSRQVESGISSRSMSVWVFVCLCPLCPAAALQIRRHHSLAGNSKTLSWVISNSCAHLDWG
jgi:hypothetical protein